MTTSAGPLLRLAARGTGAEAIRAAIDTGAGMTTATDADADAVVVADETTAGALALAREALASGKPTLCLALPPDLATLDELTGLAARHGAPLSLPNTLRYLPATIALCEAVARGDAGLLFSVFASWHTSRALGDPLGALGPALLDLLGWGVPGTIERAQVTAGALFGPERGAAALTLRGADGLVRTVELAASLPIGHEQEDELLIEVLGETAALRAEPFNQAITIIGVQGRGRRAWGAEALDPILDAFAAALRTGQELPGEPAALRPTLALLAELREAASDGAARALAAVG